MKTLIQSKTFWVNVITIAIAVAGLVQDTFPVDPKVILLISGVLNILLRTITTQQIVGFIRR